MAVGSLSKMTVPLPGDSLTQGLLMPKLKYRFRVTFTNFGPGGALVMEMTKQVMDFTRPSVSFEDITIDVYNSKIKLAGKHSWEDVTVNLRDDASGTVTTAIAAQLQRQLDFFEQASAAAGGDYKFITRLEVLDGANGAYANQQANGGVLETWEMYGCFIQAANYNDMNYASSEVATIALTLRFDNAMQVTGPDGAPIVAGYNTTTLDGSGVATSAAPIGAAGGGIASTAVLGTGSGAIFGAAG